MDWLSFVLSGATLLPWIIIPISWVVGFSVWGRQLYVERRITELGGKFDFDDCFDWTWQEVTLVDNELSWCLRNLVFLRSIDSLGLSSTSIRNADVKYLRWHRKSLEMLYVSDTNISNDFVRGLSRFPRLHRLNLARTRVSDECIAALATIPDLRWVDLSGTDCTVEGIDRLSQLKPTCHIVTGSIDDHFQAE